MTPPQVFTLSLNTATIALVIAQAVLLLRYRRTRYSAGWVEGRIALIVSMAEAQERGIPFDEWISAEAQRDAANHLPGLLEALARVRAEGDDRDH